jgi:hypothetical protein
VAGASSAFYDIEPFPFEIGRPTMTMTTVQIETADRSYGVMILAPRDADGDHVAQQFVQSIRVTGSAPPCLSAAGFRDVVRAAGMQANYDIRVNPASPGRQCSGTWAVADLDWVFTDQDGTEHASTVPQLFRYVSGTWTPVDRVKYCQAGMVPADIEYLPCETT